MCLFNLCTSLILCFSTKHFLAAFKTAVRSSLRRQQYKNGLIDEFIKTTVSAKFHMKVQRSLEMVYSDKKIGIGR